MKPGQPRMGLKEQNGMTSTAQSEKPGEYRHADMPTKYKGGPLAATYHNIYRLRVFAIFHLVQEIYQISPIRLRNWTNNCNIQLTSPIRLRDWTNNCNIQLWLRRDLMLVWHGEPRIRRPFFVFTYWKWKIWILSLHLNLKPHSIFSCWFFCVKARDVLVQ